MFTKNISDIHEADVIGLDSLKHKFVVTDVSSTEIKAVRIAFDTVGEKRYKNVADVHSKIANRLTDETYLLRRADNLIFFEPQDDGCEVEPAYVGEMDVITRYPLAYALATSKEETLDIPK